MLYVLDYGAGSTYTASETQDGGSFARVLFVNRVCLVRSHCRYPEPRELTNEAGLRIRVGP